MLDSQLSEALDRLGISRATQARLDLFGAVPPPQSTDEFLDTTAAPSVTFTAGEITLLRGALRIAVASVMDAHLQALRMADFLGRDVSEGFQEGGPELGYVNYLNCEDRLAEAFAVAKDDGSFAVPDYYPADL